MLTQSMLLVKIKIKHKLSSSSSFKN